MSNITEQEMANNVNSILQKSPPVPAFGASRLTRMRQMNAKDERDSGEVVPSWLRPVPYTRQKVTRGRALYQLGDASNNLYVVRYGMFKTVAVLIQTHPCITGFRLCGDVMGLESVGDGNCVSSAVALEDSEVNVVSYRELLPAIARNPPIGTQLQIHMSREMASAQNINTLLRELNAERRLAFFFLDLTARLSIHGYSPTRLTLRMTRMDIASYLSLSNETVSRAMSRLIGANLIDMRSLREVSINDLEALRDFVWGRGFPVSLLPANMRTMHC